MKIKKIDIDQDRLANTFMELVRIDSVSKEEAAVCQVLQGRLKALGADIYVDGVGEKVGGDTGNLIARFAGADDVAPLLLSAHMDTVEPGRGVEPLFRDGIFTSSGRTILGADDKCGIAIILEAVTTMQEKGVRVGPIEIVFSICEELGLQGTQHLDFSTLSATMGYVLDTRHTGVLINRAPAANHIRFKVSGRAAHAGAEPEKGINAIALAGEAIAQLELGRIDAQTTCNIGTIHGGVATNVVPDMVVVEAEVRSHDAKKLDAVTEDLVDGFKQVIQAYTPHGDDGRPSLSVDIEREFERVAIDEGHEVVILAKEAAAQIGLPLKCVTSGGGSDASVFTRNGIVSGVLGTGCDKVHTVEEQVALKDMVGATQLLIAIIQLHANKERTL